MKDWKTTTAGIIGLLAGVIVCFPNQFGGKNSDLVQGAKAMMTLGFSTGLFFAGDSNKKEDNG